MTSNFGLLFPANPSILSPSANRAPPFRTTFTHEDSDARLGSRVLPPLLSSFSLHHLPYSVINPLLDIMFEETYILLDLADGAFYCPDD